MTDRKPLSDQTETPEDVATLYSWANLHGAKYRDFSAARAQTREKTRLQMQEMRDEQERKAQQEAEGLRAEQAGQAQQPAEISNQIEAHEIQAAPFVPATPATPVTAPADVVIEPAAAVQTEPAVQQPSVVPAAQGEPLFQPVPQESQRSVYQGLRPFEMAAQFAAQQVADRAAARLAAEKIAAQNAAEEAQLVADQVALRAAQHAAEVSARRAAEAAAHRIPEPAAQPVAPRFTPPVQPTWQPAPASGETGDSPLFNSSQPPFYPQPYDYSMFTTPQSPQSAAPVPQAAQPHREATATPSSAAWSQPEQREPNGRPAWLMNDRAEVLSQAPVAATVPQAPEDTLQGSRERMASRWFALRSVFEAAPPTPETVREPVVARAPALAVFSLAGGVGKTSLVATLGRALSARGERVLLVDTAAFGLLPFFFGARDQRPGMLRTFSPPGVSTDAPIQMVTLDPEGLGAEVPGHENLTAEISKYSRGVSRVIVDLATASGATTRRILRMQPLILVPMVPDMSSVVSVSSIDAFFDRNGNPGGKASLPYYILNQFDPSLPLNLDVREVLREQLGDRLLPFALRRAPAINEALAEGMTVMDYAPNSALAEDFGTLATWVKSLSAPATTTYRGVRWSER